MKTDHSIEWEDKCVRKVLFTNKIVPVISFMINIERETRRQIICRLNCPSNVDTSGTSSLMEDE